MIRPTVKTVSTTILVVVVMSFVTIPVQSFHPDISDDRWFVYDSSFRARAFGIIDLSFDARHNVSVVDIVNDTVVVDVKYVSGDVPLNVTDLFQEFLFLKTNMLNDTITMDNTTIDFPSSTEMDHTKMWRGVPIRTLQLNDMLFDGNETDEFLGDDVEVFLKYDNVTGVLYQVFLETSVMLVEHIELLITVDVSLVDADTTYKLGMSERYDDSLTGWFLFQEFVNSPVLLPLLILSIVIIVMVVILVSSRSYMTKDGKPISTGKAPKTKRQKERERLERRRKQTKPTTGKSTGSKK